jgi:zona occludens toxin (predicted ATPase)
MSRNPGPGIYARMSRLSSLVAADMHSSAETLEARLPLLEHNVTLLEESYTGYVNWYTPENEEQTATLRNFRDTMSALHEASSGSLPNIAAYRDAVVGLRGISANIGAASRRLSHQIDGLVAITEKVVAFSARTMGLIDDKLAGRQPRI